MRTKKPNAGFTLPEVLTAVVIVGLVLVTLYSCWAAVLGATQSSTIAVQDAQRERMAIRAISDALAGVSWYENRKEGPLRLDDSLGFSHLKLISRVPPGFWGERELANYPLRRIEFVTEDMPGGESQLVMIQQALLAPTNSVKVHRTVLLPHVETFAVEVHSGGISNTWEAFWPTLFETNGLPWQAKVSLGAVKEFPRKSVLPIFASMASHAGAPPGSKFVVPRDGLSFPEDGFDLPDTEGEVRRVVFIIDKSTSMKFWKGDDRLGMAKEALLTTLRKMSVEEGSKFFVYFFNKDSEGMPGSRTMREANGDNIRLVEEWLPTQQVLDNKKAKSGEGILDCIQKAFRDTPPTEVFLLTDPKFLGIWDDKNKRYLPDQFFPVRDALNAFNKDSASFNIYISGADKNALAKIFNTEAGAEMLKIVEENGGKIYPLSD